MKEKKERRMKENRIDGERDKNEKGLIECNAYYHVCIISFGE